MSIVTKTGDKGETSLLNGTRVPKSDPRIEFVGDLDELSAQLGHVNRPEIQRIQRDLFELGAGREMGEALKRIEQELYALEPTLPPLKNFILPGGHPDAARLHLARAVCRRAERHAGKSPYLNRLSDYLFLLARQVNLENNVEEIIWKS